MDKDIVFIDTNVFVSENYFLEDNSINRLLDLAQDGYISILWPEIAYNEVKAHFVRDMEHSFKQVCGKEYKVLRNHPAFLKYCQKGSKEVKKKALELLENFKNKSNAYIIPFSYCDNVKDVFEKYFDKKKPFGIEKKKDEFPDAFIIQSLEKYIKKSSLDKEIIVLTNDKDYVEASSYLTIINDYKKYISEKLATKEEFDVLYDDLESEQKYLVESWKEEIENILYDDRTYFEFCNYDEISQINIESCDIEFDYRDLYILNNDETHIEFEVNPLVSFSVDVTFHDTSEASYDKEFDEWYGDEWRTKNISLSVTFKSTVKYNKQNSCLEILNSDYSDIENEISYK